MCKWSLIYTLYGIIFSVVLNMLWKKKNISDLTSLAQVGFLESDVWVGILEDKLWKKWKEAGLGRGIWLWFRPTTRTSPAGPMEGILVSGYFAVDQPAKGFQPHLCHSADIGCWGEPVFPLRWMLKWLVANCFLSAFPELGKSTALKGSGSVSLNAPCYWLLRTCISMIWKGNCIPKTSACCYGDSLSGTLHINYSIFSSVVSDLHIVL